MLYPLSYGGSRTVKTSSLAISASRAGRGGDQLLSDSRARCERASSANFATQSTWYDSATRPVVDVKSRWPPVNAADRPS